MITIERLEVLFDAERERDEARFAELFVRHMVRHDDERSRTGDKEAQARRERSVSEARNSW